MKLRTLSVGLMLLGLVAFGAAAQAAAVVVGSTSYSQNFDGMSNDQVSALPAGWAFNNGAAPTFAAGTTDTTQFGGTTGTGVFNGSSAGGSYLLVNGVRASGTDKAIGFLTSSGFTSPRSILFAFTNDTGLAITDIELDWDYEQYRSGTREFNFSLFASDTDGTWGTAIVAGGQNYAAEANNTTVFNPPSSIAKGVTLSGLNIANGSTYYLRWDLAGVGGSTNGKALGIDNFSMNLTLIPEPASAGLLTMALGALLVARRRRR
jgi:hypothetical protein